VVVVQEAFGVNAYIQDVTRRFAAAGYHAIAPHLFHRSGSPALDYGDLEPVMAQMQLLTDAGTLDDVGTAVGELHAAGWTDDRIGIVGFCMGGRVSFLVAGTLPLGAAVGFYGGGIVHGRSERMPALIGMADTLRAPWLGLFGDADRGIPVEEVEELRRELATRAPVETEIVRYPGTEQGFDCDARPSYSAEAATDAWGRTLAWLDRHLAAPAD
jgi:carboxymethylenebutenolidase